MATAFNTINEANFRQPDMGEYYNEELMEELLQSIEPNNAKNAAYYVEEPFSTTLGYHENYSAFVLKADPVIKKYDNIYKTSQGERNETINAIDGDTIPFYLDSVSDGDMPFEINGEKYNNFRHYAKNKMDFGSFKNKIFKIRTVGINAPEVPHLEITPVKKSDLNNDKIIRYFSKDLIGKRSDLVYLVNKNRSESTYRFIYNEDNHTWHEVVASHGTTYPLKNEDPNKTDVEYFTTVSSDEQTTLDMDGDTNLGLYATELALNLLNNADDIRIVLDAKQLYTSKQNSTVYQILQDGWNKDNSLWKIARTMWHRAFGDSIYKYAGFGTFGQDAYRRFLGAVYVKTSVDSDKSVWINLAKYIRSKVGDSVKLMPGVSPEAQANGNNLSDAFKVWSYDNSKSVIADGFYNISKSDFDDRRSIQKEITGLDFETYRDYTVMIGDCLFMVPPTSIRVINQINSNRVPLLRSKGSAVKELPHNDRLIEMTLYFNGEEGINGIAIEKQLPRQVGTNEKTTYYMNGLRCLISMLKFTPFVPIENEYINDVLGIEAVSLANIQIQTMPMYPKCLAVSLTLQQFNYRIYLNELPLPEPEEGQNYNTNMFAKTINYEVMRYYYQKSIIAGEALKNIPANSQEFIEKTMGHSTALIPMDFKDQTIDFMILDNDWLDKMKQVKDLASKQPINQTTALNETTIKWASQVGVTLGKLLDLFKGGITTKPEQGILDSFFDSDAELSGRDELKSILIKNLLNNNSSPLLSSVSLSQTLSNLNEENCVLEFSLLSLSTNEINNLMKKVMKELNTESQKLFSNGILKLKLNKSETKDKIVWTLNTSTEEYKMAEFFAYRSGYGLSDVEISYDDWDMFATSSNEETFESIKEDALDTETLLSAKFIDYPIDNLIVQNFSISMGNILSNTKLKSQDGYAPQYAGGQDTVIEFTMHTMDKEVVTALNAMQEMAAQQLIRYSSIIKCWPIRIVSEMTKLCGIHEVIIDSIDISTVPMQPGLFAINCRAISVDRTVRNKEALQRLDSINNAGATNPNSVGSWIEKTYFDLNNTLSQAEIYPDLELPTIEELNNLGFKFIRYMKNDSSRIYPDPDFYFIYGYTYSSQMLRKSIVDYFEKNSETGKAAIEDITRSYFGTDSEQEYTVKYNSEDKNQVLKYDAVNKELEAQYNKEKEERSKKILETRKQEGENVEENAKNIAAVEKLYYNTKACEDELAAMSLSSWDICSNIKCVLPEYIPADSEEVVQDLNDVTEKLIDIIDDYLSKPIDTSNHKTYISMTSCFNYATYHDKSVYPAIKDIVKLLLNEKKDGIWKKLLSTLNIDASSSKVRKIVFGIFEAAAMAMSGNSEYSPKNNKDNYCSRAFFLNSSFSNSSGDRKNTYPFSKMVDEKTGEEFYATTNEMALNKGITFGVYQIRKYNKEFLQSFYEEESVNFSDMDFLDPYYNTALHKKNFNKDIDTREYKTKLIESNAYAVEAFNRIVLVWVKRLLQDRNYISYYDIRRDNINDTLGKLLKEYSQDKTYKLFDERKAAIFSESTIEGNTEENEKLVNQDENEKYVNNIKNIVNSYEDNLIAGKIFLPVICAVTHGDSAIYDKISSKNVGALNAKTRSCQMPLDSASEVTEGDRNFRKLIRGLAATDAEVMTDLDGIASEQPTKLENALIERNERLWLEASEDPSLWIMHSFYDMIVHDKRGRMARAFPTYYMLLIDEGREIGYWKLHDNFYNMSSISEIEVTKSRKMPADTARIVMTNLYKTFSTEDEDVKVDYEHNIKDVFNSIFSPSVYFEEEETNRINQSNINRATIKPGVRIHLRMGYSGDAASLPILFNGVVAEASTGELIELIAQSDGHEIANDQAFATASTKDLSDLKHEDSFFAAKWIKNFLDEGATPKTLIKNMLTTKSGWLGKQINEFTNGRFFNDNMFGVTHFGEIDYKHIHSNGEVMQNIYEAEGRMPWQNDPEIGSLAEGFSDVSVPAFTIDVTDKSIWDVLNICASSSLEFITGIAPFGLRSTIFFGRPHYYYAYDYAKDDNGMIVEKRKPYQQYHIIDSYSDIIGNSIIANGTKVKTVAVPMYKGPNVTNKIIEKKGTTLFADWDIYPEYQKTMVVNTGMTWKGNKLGGIFINSFKDKVSNDGGAKIAWRMGATALKNSFKDMYEGEVIIIGDTSIKPMDKVFLYDTYENIDGAFEVEAVVHRLDPETGFTSSVYPDCIATVDSRYEEIGQMWSKQVLTQVVVVKMAIHANNLLFRTTTKPMLNTIAKLTTKGLNTTADTLKKTANLIGQEDLAKYCSTEKWSQSFLKALNISTNEVSLWNTVDKLKNFTNVSSVANATVINSSKDLMSQVKKIIDASEGSSVDDVVKTLQSAIDNGNVKSSDIDKVQDSIKEIKKLGEGLDNTKLNSSIKTLIEDSVSQLTSLKNADKLDDAGKEALNILKDLQKIDNIDIKSAKKAVEAMDKVSDVLELTAEAKSAGVAIVKHSDDMAKTVSKVSKLISNKNLAGTIKTIGRLAGGTAIAASIVAFVFEAALMYVFDKTVYNWIENLMSSFNVLTVYPLKKKGTAHVAGIDGHKGLVVGSATWSQEGPIGNFINWVFEDRDSKLYNAIKWAFFSDDMIQIAETYKKDNSLGDYTNTVETSVSGLLESIAESQASNYSNYRSMVFSERITSAKSAEAQYTYKKTRVVEDTLEDIVTNNIIRDELVPITAENAVLEPYFNSQILKLAHNQSLADADKIPSYKFDNVSAVNGSVETFGIKLTDTTVDLPFLRPDAFQLFNKIIEHIVNKANVKKYGEGNNITIWFKSGTIVNDKSWASTGYMFRFEVTNFSNEEIEETMTDLGAEIQEIFSNSDIKQTYNIFNYRKLNNSNAYEVFVSPRNEYIKLQLD